MQIERAEKWLDEPLRMLDEHHELHNGDALISFRSLGKAEKQFIEGEIMRCRHDLRYYLENYHVIKTNDGFRTFFPMWDSQEIVLDRVNGLRTAGQQVKLIVLKARQVGLSTFTQAIVFHDTIFTEASNALLVAQDPGAAAHIFEMSRNAYEYLPWWMRPEKRYDAAGKWMVFDRENPRDRVHRPGLKSQILVEAANKMTGVAVGKTFQRAHMSELSLWPDGGVLMEHLLPSMHAPDMFAVMESTARGKQGFWYRLWLDAMAGRIPWEPVFIEFYRRREYVIPIPEGQVFEKNAEEHSICEKVLEETGISITDETLNWRRAKMAEAEALSGDVWKFYQEYPLNWRQAFQASGLCAFDKRKLQTWFDISCARPLWTGEIKLLMPSRSPKLTGRRLRPEERVPSQDRIGNRLFIWEAPQKGKKYYIGADVAHGIEGGDFSCASVFRIGEGQERDFQVAEWHGWINATPYAHVLAALGYFYNNAEIACEANDIGRTTNNELLRAIEYEHLYRWKHEDKIKNFMTDYVGWETNGKTRSALVNKMREAVDDHLIVLRSEATVDQMMSFAMPEDGGRFEGQDTEDDRVFANMICFYCAHQLDWGNAKDYSGEDDVRDPNKDFFNTEFSPVHDIPGIRRDIHVKGQVPAELILYESIHLYEDVDPMGEDEHWKLY